MAEIRKLPDHVINQIAAGEVIERPFAVVKELIENSIDAQSKKIEIHIRDGGKSFIQIKDDGYGINRDDLRLAIQRHATSKLPHERLHDINSYGFRGEALPSIASVARMRIASHHHQSHDAWSLTVEGGVTSDPEPDSLSQGTIITVRDLFFNIPARLKFLRASRTETIAINDIITRLALANPDIAFSLYDDNKCKYHYHAIGHNEDYHQAKYQRIKDIMGNEYADNIITCDDSNSDYNIYGYIGLPTYNRAQAQQQYFFINQRPVKDKLLIGSLKAAYGDLLPSGRYAVACLWIDCNGLMVDVNAHPAKTEVRFRDPQSVRHMIIRAVNKALQSKDAQNTSSHLTDAFHQFTKQDNIPSSYNQISSQPYSREFALKESRGSLYQQSVSAKKINDANQKQAHMLQNMPPQGRDHINYHHNDMLNNKDYPLGAALAQIYANYIIAENNDGLILVDQHAAHERIIYEYMKEMLIKKGKVKSQILLLPEIIALNADDLHLILSRQDDLAQLGLNIADGSNDNHMLLAINEVPALLGQGDVRGLIHDMIDCLRDLDGENILQDKLYHICATMACHGSIRSGRILTYDEMNALLREIESIPNSAQCNHGRPSYVHISRKDIEKLFERR